MSEYIDIEWKKFRFRTREPYKNIINRIIQDLYYQLRVDGEISINGYTIIKIGNKQYRFQKHGILYERLSGNSALTHHILSMFNTNGKSIIEEYKLKFIIDKI